MNGSPAHHRVVLDLQACQTRSSRGRGIGRYSGNLARALLASPGHCHISVALNAALEDSSDEVVRDVAAATDADRLIRYHATQPAATWTSDALDAGRSAGEWLAQYAWLAERPDLVHVSSLFEGLEGSGVVPSLAGMPGATAVSATLYDLIPLLFADDYLRDPGTRSWYMSRVERLRRCDVLLAISEATRRDIMQCVGIAAERVVNIQGAADARFTPPPVAVHNQIAAPPGLGRPYVMYTGGIDHRKNVEALIRAYALLPPAVRNPRQLAIVCSVQEHDRLRLTQLARKCGLHPDTLVLTGFVTDDALVELYRRCELFVFPSMYEGFGLPALEAMACGAATIAADTSSLPEIVGREDALFDPRSDESIAQALARGLTDIGYRDSLRTHAAQRARKFSWQTTADRTKEAWEEAIARKTERVAINVSHKPRLALVTPLIPERSGIAHFASDLLPYLAQHFEIDLFCSTGADRERYRKLGFAVHGWEALSGCFADYDGGVLYQMGNSEFHVHMLALLTVCPGTVLLHDAYLSGLMAYCEFGPPRLAGFFGEMLAYCHRDPPLHATDRDSLIERYPMTRWVGDKALGLMVTSAHAMSVLDDHAQADRARCAVVPLQRKARLLSDSDRSDAKRELGIPSTELLVCAFGYVDERKLSLEILDAWSDHSIPSDARLVFVGEAASLYGETLRRRIAGGAARNVEITGYVDEDAFETYMKASDVVVQLRKGSRGEASGAALYALAFGAALVASRHGSLAEIPNDACVHVDSPLDVGQLAHRLCSLLADSPRRRVLGEKAHAWIRECCDPARVARDVAVNVRRFNDPALVQIDGVLDQRLATLARVPLPEDALAWTSEVRGRARASRSSRTTSDLARSIDGMLASLLPRPVLASARGEARELDAGPASIVLSAADARLVTTCGIKAQGLVRSNGAPGILLHGPYMHVEAGNYRIRVYGSFVDAPAKVSAVLDVTANGGKRELAQRTLGVQAAAEGMLGRLDFSLDEAVDDLEIRIHVPSGLQMMVESLDLVRLSAVRASPASPAPGAAPNPFRGQS